MSRPLHSLYRFAAGTALAAVLCLALGGMAQAETGTLSQGLGKALAAPNRATLYHDRSEGGAFSLSSAWYSGLASGVDLSRSSLGDSLSSTYKPDLVGDQRVYALLLDGAYDFNHDAADSLSLHPYIGGGLGMAMSGPGNALQAQSGAMVPLFRLGGGLAYRLGEKWNLSLDYKAGITGPATRDQTFTGRDQHPIDMQTLNMGMRYAF